MTDFLLIEDNQSVQLVVRKMLESMGHSVRCASDGDEGVTMFKKQQSTHVITDMLMPEKEGLETIDELRQLDPGVKILAISGGWRFMEADTCLTLASNMGADATLEKPFTMTQLRDALKCLAGE